MKLKNWKRFNKSNSSTVFQDPFIRRLGSSVIGEGMLAPRNIELIAHAIEYMPEGGPVLEIGCWAGKSSAVILHFLKKYKREVSLWACDPWIYEGLTDHFEETSDLIDGEYEISREQYMEYIKSAYMHAMKLFHPQRLPFTFRLTSDVFFDQLSQGTFHDDIFGRKVKLEAQFSFCYIDGNHAYEYAKRDFEHVHEYLLPKGFILLDDSSDGAPFGSAELMKEIKKILLIALLIKNIII